VWAERPLAAFVNEHDVVVSNAWNLWITRVGHTLRVILGLSSKTGAATVVGKARPVHRSSWNRWRADDRRGGGASLIDEIVREGARHRVQVTRGPGSRAAGLVMASKLLEAARC
jgi:hypothetical protein